MADAQDKGQVTAPTKDMDMGALVASGEALVKLENETQMMVAIQRPRDEVAILAASIKELSTYKSCAEGAVYAKPVGREIKCPSCGARTNYKEQCPSCGSTVPMKFARGLSIRTAESLASRWDNSAWSTIILPIKGTDDVQLVATFLDYERNIRHVVPKRVSRTYKSKFGKMVTIPADRFADVVIPKNTSVVLRNVILRSLPAGLKADYWEAAEKILTVTSPEVIGRMVNKFSEIGATKEMIEEQFGKTVDKLSGQDILNLRGMANAIEGGELTVDQAFGASRKPVATEPTAKGAPDAAEVLNGKATAEEVTPPKDTAAPKASPPSEPPAEAEEPKEDPKRANRIAEITPMIEPLTEPQEKALFKSCGIKGADWRRASDDDLKELMNKLIDLTLT